MGLWSGAVVGGGDGVRLVITDVVGSVISGGDRVMVDNAIAAPIAELRLELYYCVCVCVLTVSKKDVFSQ